MSKNAIRAVSFGLFSLALAAPVLASNPVVQVEDKDLAGGKMAMILSVATIPAGKIDFVAKNTTDKKRDHEVVMIKTDVDPAKLPRTIDGQSLDEKKLGKIYDIGDLHPGKSKKVTLKLEPGNYLLFCNLQGHVDLGMFAKLTVTAAK